MAPAGTFQRPSKTEQTAFWAESTSLGAAPRSDGTGGEAAGEEGAPAQAEGGTTSQSEGPAAAEEPALAAQGSQDGVPLAAQGSQDGVPLAAQGAQESVPYVNENGGLATRDEYTLITAEPAGEDPLTLSGGWYVVQGQVTATKRIEVQGDAHLILCDGAVGGTTGRALRLEAPSLGVAANMGGGVSCRAHVANRGWLGWARDGQVAGTVGEGRRAEAIQVVLVRRGAKAPGARYGGAAQSFPRPYRKGGTSAR